MAEIDINEAVINKDSLENLTVSNPTSLPFSLLNKQGNRTTKLLANSPDKSLWKVEIVGMNIISRNLFL